MINDKERMDAYESALFNTVHGKVVLEVGTGTGCLAIMAARTGATMVNADAATNQAKFAQDTI